MCPVAMATEASAGPAGPLRMGPLAEPPYVLHAGVQWSRSPCVYGKSTGHRRETAYDEVPLIILDETDGPASSSASTRKNVEVPKVHSSGVREGCNRSRSQQRLR